MWREVLDILSVAEMCEVFSYDARCAIGRFLTIPLITKVKGQCINSCHDHHIEGCYSYLF